MMHLRWSAAGFPLRKYGEMLPNFQHGNLKSIPNAPGKHRLGPHPFQNQTSKPNMFKAPKANANNLFLTANVLKL